MLRRLGCEGMYIPQNSKNQQMHADFNSEHVICMSNTFIITIKYIKCKQKSSKSRYFLKYFDFFNSCMKLL